MAVRPLLLFPDPRLRLPAMAVEHFDSALRDLADDLRETLRAADGIGITAPHIGVPQRLVVLALPGADGATYVNPVVLGSSGDMARHEEGSIAMPGIADIVERPARVRVRYQDLAGAEHEVEASGLLSVCLQHEIDQLDGIFWLQRLSRLRRERLIRRFGKQGRAIPAS